MGKHFLIYGIGGAASRLAAIILVPLYTRALSVADYGQLEVLLALYALMILLAGLQSESAVARDYFEAKAEGNLVGLLWSSLLIAFGGSLLLTLAIAPAIYFGWLPKQVADFGIWLIAMTVPSQILGIQLVILRFKGASVFFAILSFLDLSLCALFSALLIVHWGFGITGALAGIVLSKLLCVTIAWARTFGAPARLHLSRELLHRMLAYALPSMPAVLLNWLQNNGSRILLALFLTFNDVALAGLAIKVSALYGFIIYSFRLAWEPYSIERLGALETDPGVYNRALQWYVLTMYVAAGLATLASPWLVAVLAPPAYGVAANLAVFFIIGQFWVGAISILCIGIQGARLTSRLTHVYTLGAIVNVATLILLASAIGVMAAAIGFMVSAMVSALLAAFYSERLYRTGFSKQLVGWTVAATCLFAASCFELQAFVGRSVTAAEKFSTAVAVAPAFLVTLGLIILFGLGPRRVRAMWAQLSVHARLKAVS